MQHQLVNQSFVKSVSYIFCKSINQFFSKKCTVFPVLFLLLGRATSRIPSGLFERTDNPRHRYEFIQGIIDNFWRRWTRDFFPSLIIRQKWHTATRNLRVGDVVLIQDSNQIRGQWKLGKVCEVFPGDDGDDGWKVFQSHQLQ